MYADDKQHSAADAQTQTVIASQFFTQNIMLFDEARSTKKLTLLFDDTTQFYYLRNIHIELHAGFFSVGIGDWNGQRIGQLLLNKELVSGANAETIEFKNDGKKKVILFNNTLHKKIEKSIQNHISILSWKILCSLTLSVFIVLIPFQVKKRLPLFSSDHETEKLSLASKLFFALLFIMLIASLIGTLPDKKSNENRRLEKYTPLTASNVFQYPDLLTNYVNDHFAFRNVLFYCHSLIKATLFKSSSLPERVIIGKKGWFFETDPLAIQDYRKLNRFTDTALNSMVTILRERIQWLEKRGIRYYIVIPPNRNRIYDEFFPDRYTKVPNYGHDRLDYYKQYLKNKHIILLDPTDSLQHYSNLKDVYYSTDTHWNMFGAWVGYNYLLNEIRKDFPCLHPIEYNDLTVTDSFNNHGDLAGMLELEDVYRRKEYTVSLKDTTHALVYPPIANIIMNFKNEKLIDSCNLTLLMFRDSYSNYLIPFLNLHFKEATYVWSYDFLHELIEEKKPDIVILEVQQRAMIYGLENKNLFKTP
jgi:hypothetical protein